MRDSFVKGLMAAVEENKQLMLVTADLGYGVFDEFVNCFPKNFINLGITEQAAMGVAAGLALEGKVVYFYSIGNFPTMRCLEQIRNDCCYHNLNVNIVSNGAGFSYGQLGMSHHATEDVAIMRSIPGIEIYSPSTALESKLIAERVGKRMGPTYTRLDKRTVSESEFDQPFQFRAVRTVRDGSDFTVISTSSLVEEALTAAIVLRDMGVSLRVLACHCLDQIAPQAIENAARETAGIVCFEENLKYGGLGSAVGDLLLDLNIRSGRFRAMGIERRYFSDVGSQQYLRERAGLTASHLVETVVELLGKTD